jgi:transposase InsO family protein
VRFTFILAEKAFYPIAVLCRVLNGFHAWAVRPPPRREVANRQLAVQVAAIHRESRCTYGSPRVTQELRASGQSVSRNRVARTMKIAGLVARPRKRFKQTTDSKHDGPIAPNILGRMFATERPNQVWVTDVKAVRTTEGWLFVAPVIDLFSRKVVGLGVRENNDTALALEALNAAIANRHPAPGLVHHSDRGAPYASKDYRDRLQAVKSLASMSRKGDCWDNAVSESFFSTLVHELLADQPILPMAATERSIREYIEKFYDPRRRHSTLGYVSPIEFELRQQNAALAA